MCPLITNCFLTVSDVELIHSFWTFTEVQFVFFNKINLVMQNVCKNNKLA